MIMHCWQPRIGRRYGYGGLAALALLLAVVSSGGPFGLDTGLPLTVLAGVLGLLAALDVWFGVVLCADDEGLRLSRGPRRVEQLSWAEVEHVAASSTTSRGLLRLSSLEIDLGERLILVPRHRLGADPASVAEAIRSARPNGPARR